jgi:hypothetical protein
MSAGLGEGQAAVRRLICVGALVAGLLLVPCALADDSFDLAITSNTPSVSHPRVGQGITFTVTEKNVGAAAVFDMWMHAPTVSSNLQWAGVDCGSVSSDGDWCEYSGWAGLFMPGKTFTARYSFIVLPGVRVASFSACNAIIPDANGSNDCMSASVRVIGKD